VTFGRKHATLVRMKFVRRRAGHRESDVWIPARGLIAGHRVLVRSKAVEPDGTRPVKVTIKIGLAEPDPNGWPGAAEEILVGELAEHGAELVLVVTANHAREFIAYSSSHEWLEQWGPSVLSRWSDDRPGTGVDAVMEPDWATYRVFSSR
jgi:hypothetical protein